MDQDPNYQQKNTHWETLADSEGFVVVYPRGGTGMSTWDISDTKDTNWVIQIIDQMAKEYNIDTKRVYLSGFSMGCMFTYNAMSKIADRIAAFAPCSGPNVMGATRTQRPVPIIHVHGTNDDVLPYAQVESYLKNYRDQFKCPAQAKTETNYPNSENPNATMYTWGPCDDGVYIKHLKLQGRGHSPSAADIGDIWNFVKEYSLDGVPPAASSGGGDAGATAGGFDMGGFGGGMGGFGGGMPGGGMGGFNMGGMSGMDGFGGGMPGGGMGGFDMGGMGGMGGFGGGMPGGGMGGFDMGGFGGGMPGGGMGGFDMGGMGGMGGFGGGMGGFDMGGGFGGAAPATGGATTAPATPATKALPATSSGCSSKITAQGYKCCKDPNCIIYYTDADGDWGVENDEWCGCGGGTAPAKTLPTTGGNTGNTSGNTAPATGGNTTPAAPASTDFCKDSKHSGESIKVTSNKVGSIGDVGYELWADSGNNSATFYSDGSFSCSFQQAKDYLCRSGLSFDSTQTHQQIGHIYADFKLVKQNIQNVDYSYVGIYGWTREPLVEFYVVDNWLSQYRPGDWVGNKKHGDFTIDGAKYTVYENTRYGPSIDGDTQFKQYFSIRQQARDCGTIDITAHFEQWEKLGMTMGKMHEAKVLGEAGSNGGGTSGTADFPYAKVYTK